MGLDSLSLTKDVNDIYSIIPEIKVYKFIKSRFINQSKSQIHPCQLTGNDISFGEIKFDAIVIKDLSFLYDYGNADDTINLINKFVSRLKDDGVLLVGATLRKKINLFTPTNRTNRIESKFYKKISSGIMNNGLVPYETFCMLPDLYAIRNIFSRQLSVSKGNKLKDTIKSILLKYFLSTFSPNIIVIYSNKHKHISSFIKDMIDKFQHLLNNGYNSYLIEKIITVKPCGILLQVKIIGKTFIIRVAIDTKTEERLRNQFECISVTLSRYPDYDKVIPRQIANFFLSGYQVYCEDKIDGLVFSAPTKGFEEGSRNAICWLTDFHYKTKQKTVLSDELIHTKINTPINDLQKALRTSYEIDILILLKEYLNKILYNREVFLVTRHGDYKIENIIFNNKHFEVSGVIDWDLCAFNCFPLVDLLFFLAYNQQMKNASQEVSELILKQNDISKYSNKELITNYLNKLSIPFELLDSFRYVTWIYHISYRLDLKQIKLNKNLYANNISNILEIIKENLSDK